MISIFSQLKKYAKNQICKLSSYSCDFDPLENIIIFSDPRGGSTWITEMVMQIPKTTVLWEPLHLTEVEHFTKLNFSWRQHIPEYEEWPEAENAFEQVLRGKVLNEWTCRLSSPLQLFSSERMIVKFVRANAMIPWLTRTFDFKYTPIHLVRHPFAVVASQLNYGSWDYEFDGFKIPNTPYNDIYLKHAGFLSKIETKEEALVATWCITNMIPLTNTRNNVDWLTIFYEDLIVDPEREMNRIFSRWNLSVPDTVYEMMRKASSTTKDATFELSIDEQLSKWKTVFSTEQLQKMQDVLNYFDVKVYSAFEMKPNIS